MRGIRQRLTEAIDERISGWSRSTQLCGDRNRSIGFVRDIPTDTTDFGSLTVRICIDPGMDADGRDQLIRDWIGLWSGHILVLDGGTEVKFNSSMTVDCWAPDGRPSASAHELCEAERLRYRYRWESTEWCEGDGMKTRVTFDVHPPSA